MRRLAAFFFALCLVAAGRAAEAPPAVAAASDLQYALPEIIARFQSETGQAVQAVFGSSGNFARQIAQGAPFQMFLSADEAYVDQLAEKGLTLNRGANYAVGRIVLYTATQSRIAADFADLRAALADGRLQHFAIANPEHAPYGRVAREALEREALWQPLQKKLVLGENVSQAAQYVLSGSAQAAILPYSLALAPAVAAKGSFLAIAPSHHAPLRQRMVLLKSAGPAAKAFYNYLQQPQARAILARYGFSLPIAP